MADARDIEWLKNSANDLNNLLQVIAESSKALKKICGADPEAMRYYAFLANGLDRALGVTADISARLGGIQPGPAVEKPSQIIADPAKPRHAGPEVLNPGGPRELIMLIDDEKIVIELAAALLTDEGYRVIAMTDPFAAISTYEKLKNEISLVMLDFTMPVLDGGEVFNELKKIDPAAAVVLSSGFAEQDKIGGMLARGLRGFLPKPYTRAKLLSQIRSTLDAVNAERTGQRRVL
jgi:CheY-like chemotaxis protein